MDLLTDWFSSAVLTAAALLWLLLLVWAAPHAWRAARANASRCATALLLGVFCWWLRVEIPAGHMQGMAYHLLGINLLCLMIGVPAAFWLGSVYALLYALPDAGSRLAAVPLSVLAVVLPACAVYELLRRWALRLPENLFVYIFINGFLGAAAGMLLTGVVVGGLLQAAAVFSADTVWRDVFPVFFLLSWSEAFLSGIFTAIFVALRPQLLVSFDDSRYLARQNRIWCD